MSEIHNSKEFFQEWSERTHRTQKELKYLYEEMYSMIIDSFDYEENTKTYLPQIGTIVRGVTDMHVSYDPYRLKKITVEPRAHIKFKPHYNLKRQTKSRERLYYKFNKEDY